MKHLSLNPVGLRPSARPRALPTATNRPSTRVAPRALALAALAAVLCLLPCARAVAQDDGDLPTELIKINSVSLESAYALAEGVCSNAGLRRFVTDNGETGRRNCLGVRYLEDERMLAITATPEVIARVRALLAGVDRLPDTRSFHILVVSASAEGGIAADIPEAARRALEDITGFLPYSGFSVLGSGWIRTSGQGTTTLAGAEEFIANLAFRPTTDPTAPLLIEHFSVYQNRPVTQRVDGEITTQYRRTGTLESTFTIDPGQTVVVGTSKLDGGDSAVVVLLTAVQN